MAQDRLTKQPNRGPSIAAAVREATEKEQPPPPMAVIVYPAPRSLREWRLDRMRLTDAERRALADADAEVDWTDDAASGRELGPGADIVERLDVVDVVATLHWTERDHHEDRGYAIPERFKIGSDAFYPDNGRSLLCSHVVRVFGHRLMQRQFSFQRLTTVNASWFEIKLTWRQENPRLCTRVVGGKTRTYHREPLLRELTTDFVLNPKRPLLPQIRGQIYVQLGGEWPPDVPALIGPLGAGQGTGAPAE